MNNRNLTRNNKQRKGMTVAVLRFSAMGDVAMTLPVVWSVARQHPSVRFIVVTPAWLGALFHELLPNVSTYACEPHGRHSGVRGMYRLAKELKAQGVDTVCDLHHVLRTRICRRFLWLWGCKVRHIDKGRSEKRQLIRQGWTKKGPLRHQTERYADVFRALGLQVEVNFTRLTLPPLAQLPKKDEGERWIGIAPAAAHASKTYPRDRMHEVLISLLEQPYTKLFFFGREKEVRDEATGLQNRYPGRVFHASEFSQGLREELQLIQELSVMVSMDSGNMHLASLVGVKVVSIWGATHPYMGFLGYGQELAHCVGSSRPCRPCTAFGAHPRCAMPYPCLADIKPEEVVAQIID